MTQTHAGLDLYRHQLREAIALDLDRRRRRRTLNLALPTAAVAAAATALVLFVTASSPAGPSAADAAILRHVAAVLAPPRGTILHERAMVSVGGAAPVLYELWAQADQPHSYRIIKFGHEAEWNGSTQRFLDYNAGANTITTYAVPRVPSGPEDLAATLRELVRSGQARVDGTATIDGIHAYKLTVTGAPDRFLNGTAYIDASNYHPLELDTTGAGGEVIKFSAYEYLPATASNMQLLSEAAAHPGAQRIR
jgi:hypothetical protein